MELTKKAAQFKQPQDVTNSGKSIISHKKRMRDFALSYVRELNIPIFPLIPCGKTPLTKNGFKDATQDEGVIIGWFKRWANANIGMPTGQASGLVAIDVDPRHDGDEALRKLEKQHGVIPETWTQLTGGGGMHYLFKCPIGGMKGHKIAGNGLELKADGGYIVLCPSIHPDTGREYVWEIDHLPRTSPLAELPYWILLQDSQDRTDRIRKHSSEWAQLIQGVSEGGRDNAATQLVGHLLRHKVDEMLTWEIVRMWNERNYPPLELAQLEKTFISIAKRELERRKGV